MILTQMRLVEIEDTLIMGNYRVDTSIREDFAMAFYHGKKLRIRMDNYIHPGGYGFRIFIACAATFDRWANSTDFEITEDPQNLLYGLWKARSIINSGRYDFNTCPHTLNLDRYVRK